MNSIKPPVMAYRIGIVGNRDLSGVDINRLEAEVFRLIQQLDSGVTKVWELHNADSDRVLYDQEKPRLYMVNSLAEGADQLAAKVASQFVARIDNRLTYRFKLSCPIPFSANEYKKHFDTDEGRAQFDHLIENKNIEPVLIEMGCQSSTPQHRKEGYRAAADMLLENVDILIAIYDSSKATARGGSKETHHVAQQRKIPVIHINTESLDEINLHRKLTRFNETIEPVTDSNIDEILTATLLPASKFASEPVSTKVGAVKDNRCMNDVCQFFNEPAIKKTGVKYYVTKLLHGCYAPAWKMLYKLLKVFERQPKLQVSCAETKVNPNVTENLKSSLYCKLHNNIDALAIQYMDSYRGSFILNFLFGATAVFLAVFSYFADGSHGWSYAELVFLTLIIVTYLANRTGHWKKKAVDYRFISEYFRHVGVLALLGRSTQLLQPAPEHNSHHDPATTWMGWYLNAVIRSQGLFRNIATPTSDKKSICLDNSYVESVKNMMCKDWLEDQYRYHLLLTKRYERWETLANRTMLVLFLLIIIGVVSHLNHWHWWHPEGWNKNVFVAMAVTAFPALLAAIHGLTVQGEFERLAKRSEATAEYLSGMIERFNEIKVSHSQYADVVGDHAVEAAQVMLEEVTDWQILYRAHKVELT